MSSENSDTEGRIAQAVHCETRRCAQLVLLHVDLVEDSLTKHLLIRIANLITRGGPATIEEIDFGRQME